jgi:hypothetical protein
MAREGDKWRVVKGDCLWNIAKSVYNNPYKWTQIADANGIAKSGKNKALIFPGQLLKLPGITAGTSGGGGGSTNPSTTPPPSNKVTIDWWALDSGEERNMFCAWSHTKDHTDHYEIKWWYGTGQGPEWRFGGESTVSYNADKQYALTGVSDSAKKVKLSIKPISAIKDQQKGTYWWTDGVANEVTYDYSNNPPKKPDNPEVTYSNSKLTISISNIDKTELNCDSIEFAIYKDNTLKYKTGTATINAETNYVEWICDVDNGHTYTVRCRAVRDGNIYGEWTEFSTPLESIPDAPEKIISIRPQIISEQASRQYGVYLEWSSVSTADHYTIQWTTNPELFDTGQVESMDTDTEQGNKAIITNIEIGHRYYFRVRTVNDAGNSAWCPIDSVVLGQKPSPPTTWSNTSNGVIGENINLYWVHNATDGSLERYARLYMEIRDSAHPELQPTIIQKVIENTKDPDDPNQVGSYTINTTDPEYSFVQQGFVIKWKVQTCGVIDEYSDWSVEREINVYQQPQITLDLKNQNDESINQVTEFPFYITATSTPRAQTPISYYIEIISNEKYETVDSVGKAKVVDIGDKIYQRYYDPNSANDPWDFLIEMTPGNIDLKNDVSYTLNGTVAMNSSLSATSSLDFTVYWNDYFFDIYGDVKFNKETLEADIQPYCNEFEDDPVTGEPVPVLTQDCYLSVYRREYDGSFTLIADNIENSRDTYVTDPHPALDYARYRVTAKSTITGTISYGDIDALKVGEPYVVIQWAEEWSSFKASEDSEGTIEPTWSGSMIKIPYNVDTTESVNPDVTMIEYVGRQHPVSYYGTHLGETAIWNVAIPADDKDTIYALRRLQKWMGDVYVREPSGVGYWANITVSFNITHNEVTIPVTFNIKRVEGGI